MQRLGGWLVQRIKWSFQFGFWMGVAGITSLVLLRVLKSWHPFDGLSGNWGLVANLGVKMLIVLPLMLPMLLLLHPIGVPQWLNRHVWQVFRRFKRLRPVMVHVPEPPAPLLSRRRFCTEVALLGAGLSYVTLIEPSWVETVVVPMPLRNLPSRFAGLRIVQISDLHVNAYCTMDDVARVVEHVNRLRADVVVITGDFVDRDAVYADDATIPLMGLQARDGVFAVLGNHDYYTGAVERVKWAIKRAGVGLLVNEHVVLRRGADRLTLVGLDDPKHDAHAPFSMHHINPAAALRGSNPNDPRIVLLHNPIIAPLLAQHYRPDWILSGHTHGGQIRVPILTAEAVKARDLFVRGHYWLDATQLYVNRGIGFTGPPMRFRVRPEISVFELQPIT